MPIFTNVWGKLDQKELNDDEEELLLENIIQWTIEEARISKIPEKWFTKKSIQHKLLKMNDLVIEYAPTGLINDFACIGYIPERDNIGELMDSAGPSLLFRDPKFKQNLAIFLKMELNPVACVNNTNVFNIGLDVGMMCLLGMLMPILKEYSNEMKIQLLSMFLFGLTHNGEWNSQTELKFRTDDEDAIRTSINARVHALLPQPVQDGKEIVRLVMMTGITSSNGADGHWIVIVFDFEVGDLNSRNEKTLTPTTAFYFPEWDFDCSKLVRSIAGICHFELKKEPIRVLAATSTSFEILKGTPIKLQCACTALRHLIMCSVVSTDDLANPEFIKTVQLLDKRFGLTSFQIFTKMWTKMMEKKELLEQVEQEKPMFFERNVVRPSKTPKIQQLRILKFLLLCSPVKDPGVDISNCGDPPFLELTVDFPKDGQGDPVIISAKPLYYIDEKWTEKMGPSQQCAMQTEFLTMDILSALHQRVMLIENKLN